jgi:tRNA pseudouridine-54 N-methylase
LKKYLNLVSIGPKTYFASQTVAVVNNELDRRGI